MAFTKEQKRAWKRRPEVKARTQEYQREYKRNIKEKDEYRKRIADEALLDLELMEFGPFWKRSWFILRDNTGIEESKPIEILGVAPKDMTKKQRGIYDKWTRRNCSGGTWNERHPARYRELNKRSNARHIKQRRLKNAERMRIRLQTDVEHRLFRALRARLRIILKSKGKSQAAMQFVGCTLAQLKAHLEAQFKGCMSWDNHGTAWHIDHIVPCAYFDLSTPRGKVECFHYTNLRPLWKKENLSRFKKGVPVQQEIPFAYAA